MLGRGTRDFVYLSAGKEGAKKDAFLFLSEPYFRDFWA